MCNLMFFVDSLNNLKPYQCLLIILHLNQSCKHLRTLNVLKRTNHVFDKLKKMCLTNTNT